MMKAEQTKELVIWRGQTLDALFCTPRTIKKWRMNELAFVDDEAKKLFEKFRNCSYKRLELELESLNFTVAEWRSLYSLAKLCHKANFKSPILLTRPVSYYEAYGLRKKPRSDGRVYFSRTDMTKANNALKNLRSKEVLLVYRSFIKPNKTSKGFCRAFLRHTRIILDFWEGVDLIPKTALDRLPKEIRDMTFETNRKTLWVICLNQYLLDDLGYNYKTYDILTFLERIVHYLMVNERVHSTLIRFYTYLCKQRNKEVEIPDRIIFAKECLHFSENTCKKNRKYVEKRVVRYYTLLRDAGFILTFHLQVSKKKGGTKDILVLNPEDFSSLKSK